MAAYQLEDARVSARGGKSARLSALDGFVVIFQTKKALVAPTARMNLNARMEEGDTFNFFRDIDTWAVKYLTENSERLFGVGQLTEEQVLAKHHPCPQAIKRGIRTNAAL